MSSVTRSAVLVVVPGRMCRYRLSLSRRYRLLCSRGLAFVVHITTRQPKAYRHKLLSTQAKKTHTILGVLRSAHPRCLSTPSSTTVVVVTFLRLVPEWQTSFPRFPVVGDVLRQWLSVFTLFCLVFVLRRTDAPDRIVLDLEVRVASYRFARQVPPALVRWSPRGRSRSFCGSRSCLLVEVTSDPSRVVDCHLWMSSGLACLTMVGRWARVW